MIYIHQNLRGNECRSSAPRFQLFRRRRSTARVELTELPGGIYPLQSTALHLVRLRIAIQRELRFFKKVHNLTCVRYLLSNTICTCNAVILKPSPQTPVRVIFCVLYSVITQELSAHWRTFRASLLQCWSPQRPAHHTPPHS